MISAPSTRPMISGRMYCTTPAWCIPRLPAVSRRKQAMQKPMFLGLPKCTSTTAITPMMSPVRIIHIVFLFFTFFIPLVFFTGAPLPKRRWRNFPTTFYLLAA